MKKNSYVEALMKSLDLTEEEAERALGYLEALMVKVIKDELSKHVREN